MTRPYSLFGRRDLALSVAIHLSALGLGAVAAGLAPEAPPQPLEIRLQAAGPKSPKPGLADPAMGPAATIRPPALRPARNISGRQAEPAIAKPGLPPAPPSRVLIAIHEAPAAPPEAGAAPPAGEPPSPKEPESGIGAGEPGAPDGGTAVILVGRTPITYPRRAKDAKVEGDVTLLLLVAATGGVTEVVVEATSGSRWLDDAAVRGVRSWAFLPAQAAGVPVAAWTRVTIEFVLEG